MRDLDFSTKPLRTAGNIRIGKSPGKVLPLRKPPSPSKTAGGESSLKAGWRANRPIREISSNQRNGLLGSFCPLGVPRLQLNWRR
jgi:hypothetical protein